MDALITMDGYEDCILGVAERFGGEMFYVYDKEMVLKKIQNDGCLYEEAVEYYEYNQLGSYVGDSMPAFLIRNEDLLTA